MVLEEKKFDRVLQIEFRQLESATYKCYLSFDLAKEHSVFDHTDNISVFVEGELLNEFLVVDINIEHCIICRFRVDMKLFLDFWKSINYKTDIKYQDVKKWKSQMGQTSEIKDGDE